MDTVKFDGSNTVYAENQPEYLPLPCHKDKNGTLIVCWKLSLKERIKILFTGKMWQKIMTFNSLLQPQLLSCENLMLKERNKNHEHEHTVRCADKL